jgi:hypothetical protein
MISLTNIQWFLLVALAGMYLLTCYHVSRWARRTGRRPVLWFFVTLLCTAIPAAIVDQISRIRASRPPEDSPERGEPERNETAVGRGFQASCPHCGARSEAVTGPDSVSVCPNCGMTRQEEHLA